MSNGIAITLPKGSSDEAAVKAVYGQYEKKIRSPKGWFGTATVNIEGDDKTEGTTLLVKVRSDAFEVYRLSTTVSITLKPTFGKAK